MPLGQVDRLPAALRRPRNPSGEIDLRPVHQGHEFEIWPPDPARQRERLLQMRLCLVGPGRPGLGVAQADQRQRAQLLAQAGLRRLRGIGLRQQPPRLLRPAPQVAVLLGQ